MCYWLYGCVGGACSVGGYRGGVGGSAVRVVGGVHAADFVVRVVLAVVGVLVLLLLLAI